MTSKMTTMIRTPASTKSGRRAAMLVAAGLASAALAAPASAQYRQENAGRALDANPRSGSYGSNDDPRSNLARGRGPLVTGNQIITGNVTGGRHFRDTTLYSDPASFRGINAGSFASDRFVRDSAGVPRAGAAQIDPAQPTAFYGLGRAAPPPAGYAPAASGWGYIPTSSAAVTPGPGARPYNNFGVSNPALRASELVMPTLDAANQQSVLSASPLYGVRVWNAGQLPSDFLAPGQPGMPMQLGDPSQLGAAGFANPADRFRADPNGILRMRDELNRAAGGEQEGQGDGAGQGGNQQGNAPGLVQPLNGSGVGNAAGGAQGGGDGAGEGGGGGAGGTLRTQSLSTPLSSTALGSQSTATNQGLRYRLLVPAEKQTPLLADMRRRFERQHGDEANADGVAANRQFNLERRTMRDAEQRGQAGRQRAPGAPGAGPVGGPGVGVGVGVGGLPPAGGAPATAPEIPATAPASPTVPPPSETVAPTPPAQPDASAQPEPAPAEPVRINSLANDVQAKGLREVLASAETLMKQEKYSAALEKYQTARDVAPNNPLILMGRANALLAASYYRRAETDLRDALAQAPHLVQAQFDLKSLVGPQRLQIVVKDLKEMADAEPQQARPLLLLAYIAYNTGNEEQAATYLDAAEKRVQGDDNLLKAWRRNWALTKTPPHDANK